MSFRLKNNDEGFREVTIIGGSTQVGGEPGGYYTQEQCELPTT
ncbi:MAG: hypothetical protein ABRQ27_00340 [Clostridiaceae bacterium]